MNEEDLQSNHDDTRDSRVAVSSTAAAPPQIIKAEVNLLRLPLFALQTRGLRNLDGFECRGTITRGGQTHQYAWRVTRHATRPFPGPLARAAHLALLSILTETPTPFANPITWTWRDLCRRIGISPSGRAVARLKEAIRATAGLIVESSRAIYSRPAGQLIELGEDDRHIYSRLHFYSKHRPGSQSVDHNAVWLAGWYLDNLNALYTAPLDHELWRHLDRRSPIASRMYEYLLPNLYRPGACLRINYPLLAQSLPVRTERYFSDARKQIGPALALLTATHVLAEANWTKRKAVVAQLSLKRGPRLAAAGQPTPTRTLNEQGQASETFRLRELRDQRPPEYRLVADFHHSRWGSEVYKPTTKETALARRLIDQYGQTKATALMPLLAESLKHHWPDAKTFMAAERYVPEAANQYDRLHTEQARRKRQREQTAKETQRLEQHRQERRQLETTWQPTWDALSIRQQNQIRTAVLAANPLLARMPAVLHTKCLEQLARQSGDGLSNSDDRPTGPVANGAQQDS